MNLAIEHLNQGIAVTERRLTDAKANQKMLHGQADEQGQIIATLQQTLVDLRAALSALRGPTAAPVVIEQLKKTELADGKAGPRQTLSRKGN
jgi:hypothetical protein